MLSARFGTSVAAIDWDTCPLNPARQAFATSQADSPPETPICADNEVDDVEGRPLEVLVVGQRAGHLAASVVMMSA